MQLFSQHHSSKDLRVLNNCSIHLHLLTIGDVLDAAGGVILPGYLDGTLICLNHCFWWPPQPCPSPTSWNLWKQALLWAAGVHHPQQTVKLALGQRQRWEYSTWMDPNGTELYKQTSTGWKSYQLPNVRTRSH